MDNLPCTEAILDRVLAHADRDLISRTKVQFSPQQIAEILAEGRRRLMELIERDGLSRPEEIRAAWQHLVMEFHIKRYWGFAETNPEDNFDPAYAFSENNWVGYVVAVVVITNAALFYFGAFGAVLPYISYGWGYTSFACFGIALLLYLLWRSRDPNPL